MSASVIPFPFHRRKASFTRAADLMERESDRAEVVYRRRVSLEMEREMQAAGIAPGAIWRELEAFDRAVHGEYLRRKSSGYAASNAQGYPDGGDAS